LQHELTNVMATMRVDTPLIKPITGITNELLAKRGKKNNKTETSAVQ